MLILTRKTGEGIVIDGHIKVTVTRIKGDKVKLGVEAPEDTKVMRTELLNKKGDGDGQGEGPAV